MPTTSIPDADGIYHDYTVRRIRPGLDAWAVELERLDIGAVHRVALDHDGQWSCNCEDRYYRGRKLKRPCKHMRHLANLYRLIEQLSEEPSSPPGDPSHATREEASQERTTGPLRAAG